LRVQEYDSKINHLTPAKIMQAHLQYQEKIVLVDVIPLSFGIT
jgi:hypothetical protein